MTWGWNRASLLLGSIELQWIPQTASATTPPEPLSTAITKGVVEEVLLTNSGQGAAPIKVLTPQ